jgi:hypothetical protein
LAIPASLNGSQSLGRIGVPGLEDNLGHLGRRLPALTITERLVCVIDLMLGID